jgi:tRNA threonylcarbamoyladenosine biosynthesis protein TsaE
MKRSKKFVWTTASAAETHSLGEAIGARITRGLCVSLVGPLGAGKTVFVAAVCRGLGVREEVLSPTFVLYEEFTGRLPVAHVDLYRLDHESELDELGVLDRIGGPAVLLVEWGDRSETLTSHADAVVELIPTSETDRRIEILCTPEAGSAFEGAAR